MWNWILSFFGLAPKVIAELQPLVTEGEGIITDLTTLVDDLRANKVASLSADANALLVNVEAFVADIETVVAARVK